MAIYVGLGANLDHPDFGPPQRTLCHGLTLLADMGIQCIRLSHWYRSAPVPQSDQPWYMNAVAQVRTGLSPDATLAALLRVEDRFGRIRGERNAPRWVDLDLLDYNSIIKSNEESGLAILPHPRLPVRAFVLLPLADLAPEWRHPVSGATIAALLAALPPGQQVVRVND